MGKRYKKRRKSPHLFFLLAIIAALTVTVFGVLRSQYFDKRARGQTSRPNFIVIMTDDQRFDTMEALPTVTGRLASKGVKFNNAFISNPLCCPSRSAFLTGLYSHNNGVWTNDGPEGGFKGFKEKGNEEKTLAIWLQNAGYKTALIGKYLNGYASASYVPPGWERNGDKWFALVDGQQYYNYKISDNGRQKKYGNNAKDYATDVFKRQAVKFIQETQEPFFLLFTPQAPHASPGDNKITTDGFSRPPHAPRHSKKCDAFSAWQDFPSFNEDNVSDKPRWVKQLKKIPIQDAQLFRKAQLCSLLAVDEAIAAMLDALGQRIDNTVVIFYTDNGYLYADHRYTKKACFYEGCIRTPLFISYPAMISEAKETNALALSIDLTATIADLAGVTPIDTGGNPVTINGKSLVPLLVDPSASARDAVLLEVDNGEQHFRGTGIRTDQYKYIELESGEKELYDLTYDPDELDNQADNPDYSSVVQDLTARLAQLREE